MLVSAFLTAELVDRVITFQAPIVLGEGAVPAFGSVPSRNVNSAPRWRVVERREYGPDLMTTYAVSDYAGAAVGDAAVAYDMVAEPARVSHVVSDAVLHAETGD